MKPRSAGPILLLAFLLGACATAPTAAPLRTRAESLAGLEGFDPANDAFPPQVAEGWTQPVPFPGPINTIGAEDSPFISPDGEWFIFWFTPNYDIPVTDMLYDGVTGLYVSHREGDTWNEPVRLLLSDPGEVVGDGCPTLLGNTLYFCSVRQGVSREVDMFTADWQDGAASHWANLGEQLNVDYGLGELHISGDGRTMVFGSDREGGLGGYDLWITEWDGAGWGEPVNLGAPVNSAADENRPYLSPDGQTLWFDSSSRQGHYGPTVFRSQRQADGSWGEPEEIVWQFAGEPNLSSDGKALYFVHHYYDAESGELHESDIYVSYRIAP